MLVRKGQREGPKDRGEDKGVFRPCEAFLMGADGLCQRSSALKQESNASEIS